MLFSWLYIMIYVFVIIMQNKRVFLKEDYVFVCETFECFFFFFLLVSLLFDKYLKMWNSSSLKEKEEYIVFLTHCLFCIRENCVFPPLDGFEG